MRDSNSDSRRSHLGLFQRLDRFVRARHISLRDFWNSNRICLNFDQFTQLAHLINFPIQQPDLLTLRSTFPQQLLTLKSLQSVIPFWSTQPLNITQFVQQKATQILLQSSLPRTSTQSVPKHRNKPCASLHNQTSLLDTTLKTSFDETRRLKEHQNKMRRSELMLQKNIIRNQNEREFEIVLKVAEVNEICAKLKNQVSFTISKEEGKGPTVTRNQGDTKKVLKEKEFLREYILLKQESINKATYEKQTSNTDLKTTLIETMFLSQQLQQQMQLIRSRGITSDSR